MSKILITGNGFDLSLGLPTSYIDFIKILDYIKENNEFDFDKIYSQTDERTYENISNKFHKFDLDIDRIESLKIDLENNLWFNFFSDELKIETWIDFENKIEYVLKTLFSSIKYIRENIFSKGSRAKKEHSFIASPPSIFDKNYEIVEILKKFKFIFVSNNQYGLNEKYLIEKYNYFIDVDLNKISNYLIDELNQFKKIFNLYFEILVFPFYNNTKDESINIFKPITEHYTFNYTPSFEKIYNIETTHIHGKIDSDVNQIVLGINDVPDIEFDEKYFIPFTKYFQKLSIDSDFKFITSDISTNTDTTFFFFGHSLDTSDEDYINEIFDFVKKYSSYKKKIVIIYHSNNSKDSLLINLLNIRGKEDIQKLIDKKILNFLHIDSNELIEELTKEPQSLFGGTGVF